MAKFKDSTGHEWTPLFNVTLAREIRQTLEIDLLTLSGSGRAFSRMDTDRDLLARVLWVVCCDEAERAGIDEAEFCRRLGGQVFEDSLKATRLAVNEWQAWREDVQVEPGQPPKQPPPGVGMPQQPYVMGAMRPEFSTHPEDQVRGHISG